MALKERISQAVLSGDYAGLVPLCNDMELDAAEDPSEDRDPDMYTVHLMVLYLNNDRTNSRFLWKRIPELVKNKSAELVAAWEVGKMLWLRDSSATHAALAAFKWSDPLISTLAIALRDLVHARSMRVIANAYSTVSVEAVRSHLGTSLEECVHKCQDAGWEYDEASKMLRPVKPRMAQGEHNTGLEQLSQLSEYVSFLESTSATRP